MHIRSTTRSDLPAVTQVAYKAYLHNELTEWLWPHRFDHPTEYLDELAQRDRQRFVQPGSVAYVAVADESDAALTKGDHEPPRVGAIMGAAWLSRFPDGPDFNPATMPRSATLDADEAQRVAYKDMRRNGGVLTSFERRLCIFEARYNQAIGLKCAAGSPQGFAEFGALLAEDKRLAKLPSHWFIASLAVDPQFEGRGVGSTLVKHAKGLAEESGTPLSLVSSDHGRALGLYNKKEDMKITAWMTGLDGRKFVGGACCVWDPYHLWVKAVEEHTDDEGRPIDGEWVV